jgi:hypothetical protein
MTCPEKRDTQLPVVDFITASQYFVQNILRSLVPKSVQQGRDSGHCQNFGQFSAEKHIIHGARSLRVLIRRSLTFVFSFTGRPIRQHVSSFTSLCISPLLRKNLKMQLMVPFSDWMEL